MTIRRRAFRAALLLTVSTLSLTALSSTGLSQTPPADNPQAAGQDDSQPGADKQQEEAARDQEGAGEQRPRAGIAEEAELAQPKAWLGIGLKEVSGDLAAYLGTTEGVLVESVFPDSPAEAAGVKVGDLVVAINGQRVASPRALIETLLKFDKSTRPGVEQQRKDAEERQIAEERQKAEQKKAEEQKKADEQKQSDEQKKSEEQKKAEAEKKSEGKDKDGEKRDGAKQAESGKKNVTYPAVKLTLLRQGKELTVEVTPTERPAALALPGAAVEPGPGGEMAELEEMLRELESQGGARVFRFGPAARLGQPGAGRAEEVVENLVVVVKDEGGEATEVRIHRVGDEPAKITVREGDKTREITEDQLDQLPEKVRNVVQQALKTQQEARAAEHSRGAAARERIEAEIHERMGRAQRDMKGAGRERMEAQRRMREQLRELPDGHITIFSPEELRKMGQSAEELAAKYQKMAEEMARRGVQKAQDLTAIPEDVKELQAQVAELKKQVEQLQAQINADKQ